MSKLPETVKDRGARCVAVHGITKSWPRLNDWTTTTKFRAVLFTTGETWKHLSVHGQMKE